MSYRDIAACNYATMWPTVADITQDIEASQLVEITS